MSSWRAELDDGGAESAKGGAGVGEAEDLGVVGEEGVHGAAEVADALSVDEADLEEALVLTRGEVLEDNVLDVAWLEAMEVEGAVDGEVGGGEELVRRRGRLGVGVWEVHGGKIGLREIEGNSLG